MIDSYVGEHIRQCNKFCQQSPENTERMLKFVLATIQQHLESVPTIMADYDKHGSASKYAYSSKREGLDFIADNIHELYELVMFAKKHDRVHEMLESFLTVPGLGLVKAGFACQLFAGWVGCLDTHNITLYGIPANSLRFSKKALESTQARHRADYIGLCETLGGAHELWSRWCEHKAGLSNNWGKLGFYVSRFHVECLFNKFTDNVPSLFDTTDEPTFEMSEGAV